MSCPAPRNNFYCEYAVNSESTGTVGLRSYLQCTRNGVLDKSKHSGHRNKPKWQTLKHNHYTPQSIVNTIQFSRLKFTKYGPVGVSDQSNSKDLL